MASWTIPDGENGEEWAHRIATAYLERYGCDETCRALCALLSADLVYHTLTHTGGPVLLQIDHAVDHVELRVSGQAIPLDAADDQATLRLLQRLATTWGTETVGDRIATWCRFACMVGDPRPCVPAPTGP